MGFLDRLFGGEQATEYRYTLLRYRSSLRQSEGVPIAVVAERPIDEESSFWVAIVYQPDEGENSELGRAISDASELGRRILGNVSTWLAAQVDEAVEESNDPLIYLANENPYNLTFTEPKRREATDFLPDLLSVFAVEVLGVEPSSLLRSRRDEGRPEGFISGHHRRERYRVHTILDTPGAISAGPEPGVGAAGRVRA